MTEAKCELVGPLDLGAKVAQSFIEPLIAAVDLLDILDLALAFGAKRSDDKAHAGADIGARKALAKEMRLTDDDRAMRIAQDDARTHGNKLVDPEQAALEHFLMDQDGAGGLRRNDKRDRYKIGGECRPRTVIDLGQRAVHVLLDLKLGMAGNMNVFAFHFPLYSEPPEGDGGHAMLARPTIADHEIAAGRGGKTDEAADFEIIGPDLMRGAMQRGDTFDGEDIGANPFDVCPHGDEEPAEILDMGLACRIVDMG